MTALFESRVDLAEIKKLFHYKLVLWLIKINKSKFFYNTVHKPQTLFWFVEVHIQQQLNKHVQCRKVWKWRRIKASNEISDQGMEENCGSHHRTKLVSQQNMVRYNATHLRTREVYKTETCFAKEREWNFTGLPLIFTHLENSTFLFHAIQLDWYRLQICPNIIWASTLPRRSITEQTLSANLYSQTVGNNDDALWLGLVLPSWYTKIQWQVKAV